jgi:hypothetical protein
MANAEATAPAGGEWALANPWSWMTAGLATSGLAFLLTRLLGAEAPALRALLVCVGLGSAAAALCLRFRGGIEGCAHQLRPGAQLALATLAALLAGAATVLMLMKWANAGGLPWHTRSVFIFWLVTAPWCAALALCLGLGRGGDVSPRIEGAALVLLAGVVAFLTCWALYEGPERAGEWDSMRTFFAVLSLVAFVASPIVAARQWLRRALLSVLILLHFGGILTAIMSTPPAPWLFTFLNARFYQPYLEFMWLSNAYRFYSPEPNPASQVWFRIEYEVPGGQRVGRWLKLPDLTGEETPNYPLRLLYHRHIAITHNLSQVNPLVTPEQSQAALKRRNDQAPDAAKFKDVIGFEAPRLILGQPVPFQPDLPLPLQYQVPTPHAKMLLSSCARYVLRLPWPEHPEAKPRTVKIYRALHKISEPPRLGFGVDPCHPGFYVPYYMGEYDTAGILKDEGDPFLYWVLPMLPDPEDLNIVHAYVFLHAGDPQYKERRRPFGGNGDPFP